MGSSHRVLPDVGYFLASSAPVSVLFDKWRVRCVKIFVLRVWASYVLAARAEDSRSEIQESLYTIACLVWLVSCRNQNFVDSDSLDV